MPTPEETVTVACLCAGWCRLCDDYRPVFEQAVAEARSGARALQPRWIDIEDEAELVGDYDVETFPTLVVADARGLRFAGALEPQAETLRRVLRACLDAGAAPPAGTAPAAAAFARRLRERGG